MGCQGFERRVWDGRWLPQQAQSKIKGTEVPHVSFVPTVMEVPLGFGASF